VQFLINARAGITDESRRKQSESMRGKPAPNKGKSPSEATKAIWREQRSTLEYRQAARERFLGEKSPNWKGGVKSELNRRLDTAEWRRRRCEVYERDKWTCQDCGVKCKNSADSKFANQHKRKIQAHHIVARRDGGSDELSNLVTLCMSCHHKRERAEKRSTG
jgi:5-methylcytosine-specific restriction endonuclease McrA